MTKIKVNSEAYLAGRILDLLYGHFISVFNDKEFERIYLLFVDYFTSKYPNELKEYDILDTEMYFVVNK